MTDTTTSPDPKVAEKANEYIARNYATIVKRAGRIVRSRKHMLYPDQGEGNYQFIVEDIANDAVAELLSTLHRYDPEKGELETFCSMRLHFGFLNAFQKHLRLNKDTLMMSPDYMEEHFDQETYDLTPVEEEIDLERAIKQLPAREQMCIRGCLRKGHGFLSEFARAEGISPQRAQQIKEEALSTLQTLIPQF